MAKITFKALAVENIGPFRARQTIDLSVNAERPVVLIKALNGSGKTTLLTALQVGLYGQKALATLKRTEYEQFILALMRRDATGNSIVEIVVEVEVGAMRRHLVVKREWSALGEALQEQVSVLEDGATDVDFSQEWDEFISAILPAELVQLFLFDGEKIEALANPDRLPELLKRATETFLGIGGIDALSNDLKALERRSALKNKGGSEAYDAARANLLNWESQLEELELKVDALTQEKAAAQNAADQADAALSRYNAEAQRKGLVAYEQAAEIRSSVVQARKSVDDARTDLVEAMSDPVLPVAWLTSMWPQYEKAWERDQQVKHGKLLSLEFKKRDQRILASLEKGLPKAAAAALRQALDSDLKSFVGARSPIGPRMLDADPRDVERQLEQARSRVQRQLRLLRTTQDQADKAEQRIGQIPAEEQIAGILTELQELSKTTSMASANLAHVVHQLDEARGNMAHVKMRLNAAQERIGTEFRDRSMEAKGLAASARARKALSLFKDRLLASKAQWLSAMITAEFRKLLRKRNLMTSVLVDPETYKVSIVDGKGQELPMDRLSAGERQLLATAVLSALIKERKGRFPVVVDTPLARLDQQHRSALIQGFFATVSHQVVVLSTDQEVEGQAYAALQPFNSQEYELNFDDNTGATTARRIEAVEAC
ncbi:DNA sulfur modification protein DndD [Ralstonia solanacearum]|uniref:DNA sulfur modification protein DndD n=1 Tax=Ralstonia solanacearum TaxID=305 RepID=A0AAW5ZSW1_RALSL|nr:DNA sulfur modification protein DndD [Ralstonia solanacearum]MDB0573535.1 DNA sulfur modification protein DndD [Ralstonia solanacearum]